MSETVALIKLLLIIGIFREVKLGNPVGKRTGEIAATINTNAGPIRGLRAENGDYTMFLGIPYATVSEENPFALSKVYPRFEEPFDAIQDSVFCPQAFMNGTVVGQIDCLQLNIYVPDSASTSNPLPVLFWVHGGAFQLGYAHRYMYGPKFLVERDIILVTINYRVGPYGFMCLNTQDVPGNQGLKDQLLAVRWVKNNIEFFGGDSEKITAFGQSAGSMSLHYHLLSPHEDYFDKYVLHSGSAFTPDLIIDADEEAPMKIAATLGFNNTNLNEALALLSSTHPHTVIRAATATTDVSFWLCKEADHVNDPFITDFPINQKIVPKIKGKSVLLGFTDDESILFLEGLKLETLPMIHNFLRDYFTFDPEQLARTERIVRNFYLGGRPQSEEVRAQLINFHSDFIFTYPIDRCIGSFMDNGVEKTFYFKFSFLGERNLMRFRANITFGGAAHTDELGFLFDIEDLPINTTYEDQLMLERMLAMWTNFVKYGDPTPETSSLLPIKWKPITQQGTPYHYLKLDKDLEMGTNPFNERMSFWDLFFDGHREFQRGYKSHGTENHASALGLFSLNYFVLALVLVFR